MALIHGAVRLLAIAVLVEVASSVPSWPATPADEKSLGRQFAAQLEKQVSLSTDAEAVSRVERIGQAIAEIANTYEFPATYGSSEVYRFRYNFKVIEDNDVNAVSLPGGHIYVNSGLIRLADSDDELAGVIAHEIAHCAHHHNSHLMNRCASVDRCVALAAIAGILGRARSDDLSNILMGANMLRTGKISGYTQEAENDADRTAVAYLQKSGYDPLGLLRFMKKLKEHHAANPGVSLGIFQTHPPYHKRIAAIVSAMKEQGVEADLRAMLGGVCATGEPADGGSDLWQVVVCGRVLYKPASLGGGLSSKERAHQIAKTVNSVLSSASTQRAIKLDLQSGTLTAGDKQILTVRDEDLVLVGPTRATAVERAHSVLEYALWADWLNNVTGGE